jgi:hypothetical protein
MAVGVIAHLVTLFENTPVERRITKYILPNAKKSGLTIETRQCVEYERSGRWMRSIIKG